MRKTKLKLRAAMMKTLKMGTVNGECDKFYWGLRPIQRNASTLIRIHSL